jgi:hypothetical protein
VLFVYTLVSFEITRQDFWEKAEDGAGYGVFALGKGGDGSNSTENQWVEIKFQVSFQARVNAFPRVIGIKS